MSYLKIKQYLMNTIIFAWTFRLTKCILTPNFDPIYFEYYDSLRAFLSPLFGKQISSHLLRVILCSDLLCYVFRNYFINVTIFVEECLCHSMII
jgi:hypothetical protein